MGLFSFARRDQARAPAGPVVAPVADGESPRLFDEAFLTRLQRLMLLSPRSIAEGLAGEHRSRRRGASPEFADFKRYSQGDDFRLIDWNTYARLDGLFVRLSEVTTEFNVHILLDASNSMDWRGRSSLPTKFTYARQAAGALGYVSLWRFDRLTVVPFGDTLGLPFGPTQGRTHTVRLLRYLDALPPMGRTSLPEVLDRYTRGRRRAGVMIVISDLLSGEPDELGRALRELRGRGWQTTLLHVLDPSEVTPEAVALGPGGRAGLAELVEVEDGQRLRLSPTDDVLARYHAAFDRWLAELGTACAGEEVDYVRLMTDWSFESIVLRLLHQRGIVG